MAFSLTNPPSASTPPTTKTTTELRDAFAKIAEVVPRLNTVTDEVNSAFRMTEELLGKLGVGIDAAARVTRLSEEKKSARDENAEEYSVTYAEDLLLIYERIAGKFRLGFQTKSTSSITTGYELSCEYGVAIPWDQASREWKLRGVQQLSELIRYVADEAIELATKAEEAIAAVNDLFRDVREASKKK